MADFQASLSEFEKRGVLVTGASVDTLEDAQKMIDDGKLTFPVGYGFFEPLVNGSKGVLMLGVTTMA